MLIILMDSGNVATALAVLTIVIPIYLVPAIIAWHRKLPQTRTVFWLNVFLGWTTIAWIAFVIYSSLANVTQAAPPVTGAGVPS